MSVRIGAAGGTRIEKDGGNARVGELHVDDLLRNIGKLRRDGFLLLVSDSFEADPLHVVEETRRFRGRLDTDLSVLRQKPLIIKAVKFLLDCMSVESLLGEG